MTKNNPVEITVLKGETGRKQATRRCYYRDLQPGEAECTCTGGYLTCLEGVE